MFGLIAQLFKVPLLSKIPSFEPTALTARLKLLVCPASFLAVTFLERLAQMYPLPPRFAMSVGADQLPAALLPC